MGNCSSNNNSAVSTNEAPQPRYSMTNAKFGLSSSWSNVKDEQHSAAALINAILPIVLPILREVACKQLIKEKFVLKDEKLVGEPEDNPGINDCMPLDPLEVVLEAIHVLTAHELRSDMKAMPEFAWPEAERYEDLMTAIHGKGQGMVVLDILGAGMQVRFGSGIELIVPIEGPLGITADLEIGSGGSIREAWIQLEIPRLRVWFVTDSRRLYLAFLERPRLVPNLHINVDRGKGDFLDMEFKGGGGLDDTIETVLCGFGPSNVTMAGANEKNKKKGNPRKASTRQGRSRSTEKQSWVANALGRRISEILGAFAGVGNNRPLEIDLNETIQESIDVALGKPRPVKQIIADMELLQKELVLAKQEEERQRQKASANNEDHEEEKKRDDDFGRDTSMDATPATEAKVILEQAEDSSLPSLFFCGFGV